MSCIVLVRVPVSSLASSPRPELQSTQHSLRVAARLAASMMTMLSTAARTIVAPRARSVRAFPVYSPTQRVALRMESAFHARRMKLSSLFNSPSEGLSSPHAFGFPATASG